MAVLQSGSAKDEILAHMLRCLFFFREWKPYTCNAVGQPVVLVFLDSYDWVRSQSHQQGSMIPVLGM